MIHDPTPPPAPSYGRAARILAVLALSALLLEMAWLWNIGPIIPLELMQIKPRTVATAEPEPPPPPKKVAVVPPLTPPPVMLPEPAPEPPPSTDTPAEASAPKHKLPKGPLKSAEIASLDRILAAHSSAGPVHLDKKKLPPAAAKSPVAGMKSLAAFRDCEECPLMVVLPTGRFRMGSADGNPWEQPRHYVSIERRFAIGRFEISERQWQACASDGYCGSIGKSGRVPVVKVSWEDTQEYLEWLRAKTGRHYRLPSESEWAYAIRGGSNASRYWGPDRTGQCLYANGADKSLKKVNKKSAVEYADCDDKFARRAPVGSFEPNAFGLRDMAGNVWEWVQDCWKDSYAGAPDDGSAVTRDSCDERVIRGGSWRMRPEALRSTERGHALVSQRSDDLGFRVAAD